MQNPGRGQAPEQSRRHQRPAVVGAARARRRFRPGALLAALGCGALVAATVAVLPQEDPLAAPAAWTDQTTLSWTPVANATSYVVVSNIGGRITQHVVTCCSWTMDGLEATASHFVRANRPGSKWTRAGHGRPPRGGVPTGTVTSAPVATTPTPRPTTAAPTTTKTTTKTTTTSTTTKATATRTTAASASPRPTTKTQTPTTSAVAGAGGPAPTTTATTTTTSATVVASSTSAAATTTRAAATTTPARSTTTVPVVPVVDTSAPATTVAATTTNATTLPPTTTVAATTTTATTTAPVGPPVTAPPVATSAGKVCDNIAATYPAAPAGAIVVDPAVAGDLVKKTDAAPAGSTFWLKPGVHTLGSGQYDQVVPKNGDTFLGAPGAVIDGKGRNDFAFTQYATNVTISNLTVQG